MSSESSAEIEWHRHWRGCLLQNTWLALRDHQARNKENLCHSVLSEFVEHGEEDSVELEIGNRNQSLVRPIRVLNFERFAVIAYLSTVSVLRGEKYV